MMRMIDYVPEAIYVKTVVNKITGSVRVFSFDQGQSLSEQLSPFDTLLEVIDGTGEMVIDETSHLIHSGESIIVPAHARYEIRANVRFKMICTIIKSGYEELPV